MMKTSGLYNVILLYRKNDTAVFTCDLRRIRRCISFYVAKSIATALISCRLDYCNSLIRTTANMDITKCQRVHNCLAMVVTRSPCFSRSVLLLKSLHWLLVQLSCPLIYTTRICEFDAHSNYNQPVVTFFIFLR